VVTRALLFNSTFTSEGTDRFATIRRGNAMQVYNSIIAGWATLTDIPDDATCTDNATTAPAGKGIFKFDDNLMIGYGAIGAALPAPCATSLGTTDVATLLYTTWSNTDAQGDAATDYLVDPSNAFVPDIRPINGTLAETLRGTLPSNILSGGTAFELEVLNFVDDINTLGAVAPAGLSGNRIAWYMGWTAPSLHF
jgi:hypothetical protein